MYYCVYLCVIGGVYLYHTYLLLLLLLFFILSYSSCDENWTVRTIVCRADFVMTTKQQNSQSNRLGFMNHGVELNFHLVHEWCRFKRDMIMRHFVPQSGVSARFYSLGTQRSVFSHKHLRTVAPTAHFARSCQKIWRLSSLEIILQTSTSIQKRVHKLDTA